jgi:hypothetical protein
MSISGRIPIYDATEPVVCTIGTDEVPERVELIERMRSAMERVERTEHGLLLTFPASASIEADLRRFVVDEKRCCQFWGFEIGDGEGGAVTLRWDGPPEASGLVDGLVAFFEGDEPLTLLSGLL